MGENIGTVGCILAAYTLGKWFDFGFYNLVTLFLGSWMMGYFVYERALNYVVFGDAWREKGDYHLMNINIYLLIIFPLPGIFKLFTPSCRN